MDDSDDDSDESSEEDRPVRKRVNRIDSDDDDEEEKPKEEKPKEEKLKETKAEEEKPKETKAEDKPKEKKAEEEEGDGRLSKGTNKMDCSLQSPTNGQSAIKSNATAAPAVVPQPDTPKNTSVTPAVAMAPNGLAGQEVAAQEDDEDDLLGVTDLVDYVCNNEQL